MPEAMNAAITKTMKATSETEAVAKAIRGFRIRSKMIGSTIMRLMPTIGTAIKPGCARPATPI
jgi:hypothetical protein